MIVLIFQTQPCEDFELAATADPASTVTLRWYPRRQPDRLVQGWRQNHRPRQIKKRPRLRLLRL